MSDQIPKLKDVLHSKKLPLRYIILIVMIVLLIVGGILFNLAIL